MFSLNENTQTIIDVFIIVSMNRLFERLNVKIIVKMSTNDFFDFFIDDENIDDVFNIDNNDDRFNSKKLNFFNFFLNNKFDFIDSSMKHINDDTMFRDVYLFITRVKNFVVVHETKMIRKNLFRCLQNDVIDWYFFRLSFVEKRIFIFNEKLNEWKLTLIKKYRKNAIKIMKKMIFNDYFEENVRNQRESREYAQQIVRVDKSIRLSIYNQLFQIWNELDIEFQHDIDELTIKIIINSFIKQLNDCKNIWLKFVVVKNKIIVTFRADNQKEKNKQKNVDERNQLVSLNTINVNVKSRDNHQNYQNDEYNQFNFFRFEFNFELQSIFISIQFQNFVSQQFQFQSYFQNRVYYSQQYNQ